MKIAPVGTSSESNTDRAECFTRDTQPLIDVLMRGARRLTASHADAEDLLQDTLLHAYAGFHTFQEGSNLKAWLFRILYNRWVSEYRSRQRRPSEVSIDGITVHATYVLAVLKKARIEWRCWSPAWPWAETRRSPSYEIMS